jgi:hypothetical protein
MYAPRSVSDPMVGPQTGIAVRNWPDTHAALRVSTGDARRRLQVFGWHQWRDDQLVGRLHLHVTTREPLLIKGYWLAETPITREQPLVLSTLVTCAETEAIRLYEKDMGNSCLERQLDASRFDYIQRLFRTSSPRPENAGYDVTNGTCGSVPRGAWRSPRTLRAT